MSVKWRFTQVKVFVHWDTKEPSKLKTPSIPWDIDISYLLTHEAYETLSSNKIQKLYFTQSKEDAKCSIVRWKFTRNILQWHNGWHQLQLHLAILTAGGGKGIPHEVPIITVTMENKYATKEPIHLTWGLKNKGAWNMFLLTLILQKTVL